MRHHVSLFLTASFLFLSQGVHGSTLNNDDDNMTVDGVAGMTQGATAASTATSSTSQDLQCYRVTLGKKEPLFDETGKFLDPRISRGDPSVPTVLSTSSVQTSGQKKRKIDATAAAGASAMNDVSVLTALPQGRALIRHLQAEGSIQEGGLASLHLQSQIEILEWLAADPIGRNNLLRTSWYYRAFAHPYKQTGVFQQIPHRLRNDLLICVIGVQSGDVQLFLKDQRRTFGALSREALVEAITSQHYHGTLSPVTEHGETYRSIGPENIMEDMGSGCSISLYWKHLRLVPLNFPEASRIESLDLSKNQLKVMPDLSHLTKLVELNLDKNQLTSLPDFSTLTNLRSLGLSENQLTSVPGLSPLKDLEILGLASNQLTSVPGLSNLKSLTALGLSNNQLTEVPDLSNLKRLVRLGLSNNPLTSAPDLSNLEKIVFLFLNNTQLTSVSGLSHLTNLEILELSNNQLTSVPDLSRLKNLRRLTLNNNQLTSVSGLLRVPNLQELHLDASLWQDEKVVNTFKRLYRS